MLNLPDDNDDLESGERDGKGPTLDSIGEVKLTRVKLNDFQRINDATSFTAALSRFNTAMVENDIVQDNPLSDLLIEHLNGHSEPSAET